jgi:predicted transposase YdaD
VALVGVDAMIDRVDLHRFVPPQVQIYVRLVKRQKLRSQLQFQAIRPEVVSTQGVMIYRESEQQVVPLH